MQDPYVGQIALFAFNFAPDGWLPCAGQLLPITQNTALYSVIGPAYGGDPQSTFALPDYRGIQPHGLQYCISLQGVFPATAGLGDGVPTIGELALLPYPFTPAGWMNCTGQLLYIDDNQLLFQMLGTRFGGDGEKTFGLPNLTSTPPPPSPAAAAGSSLYFISSFGIYDTLTGLLGTVQLLPFKTPPRGWMTCAGQLLPIAQNLQLFSLLSTSFGGDGKTTFGLPDLRQLVVPTGTQYCICVSTPPPDAPGQT